MNELGNEEVNPRASSKGQQNNEGTEKTGNSTDKKRRIDVFSHQQQAETMKAIKSMDFPTPDTDTKRSRKDDDSKG